MEKVVLSAYKLRQSLQMHRILVALFVLKVVSAKLLVSN